MYTESITEGSSMDNNVNKTTLEKLKYFSERGIPLITQNIVCSEDGRSKDMLTMESYGKWESMYIIRKDGTVERRYDTLTDEGDHTCWINNTIIPFAFHETAKNLGLHYDNRTFAMICERFVEDILENDWTMLSDYLPR